MRTQGFHAFSFGQHIKQGWSIATMRANDNDSRLGSKALLTTK
jgi:hypothetical protein